MSYNQKLEDRIDHHLIDNEKLIKNKNLGWVGWLLNGNMCFGIFDELLIVRLSSPLANSIVKKRGIEFFRQADQTTGKILSISSRIYSNNKALHKFIEESIKFTSTLPPKEADQWTNHLQ
ncbi:hypothetical protein NC796_03275 [Aliifodinibius sp. S!AR15-10]|uniref:hypothetical protein n=1 Tax=Aliifodinibius sp. S!AR15-10 TaxID=2950437 RepID=UPI002857121F|nr:hypothetical protein [Aliifodinibius sp. S!AR15-10]MDR8390147.1 hypothetical protein [Aliifodinibius sp. S!AR15-10]